MNEEAADGGVGETQPENQSEGASPEVEKQALDMGWMPKEQWKGNPENWIDAGEFVKRGETFVPFLQADRRKLKTELDARDRRIQEQEAQLRELRESVEGLSQFRETIAKERTERRKAEIGAALKEARERGDDVRVAELQNDLTKLVGEGEAKKEEPPAAKSNGGGARSPQAEPWVQQWTNENQEFLNRGPRAIALFNAVMMEKRQADDKRAGPVEGPAFLNEVRDEVMQILSPNSRRAEAPRTEETRPAGGGRSAGGGKSYADLPKEAKEQCDKDAKKFVGPNKAYKTEADYRKFFAYEYFAA